MPSDLIYREDAKDYARYAMAKGLNVIEHLDKVPAADFRPVVKSRWIRMKFFPDWQCEKCCSVISGNTPDPWNHYHYCPNCGARMEES